MANTLLTPAMITRESMRLLHQKANFLQNCNKSYDDRFAKSGAKIGTNLDVRLPNMYVTRSGATLSAQDTVERSIDLPCATQHGVDLSFTSVDLTMSLDDFSKRILDPAMAVLAAKIEYEAMLLLYKKVANYVGTVNTPVNSFRTITAARKVLTDNLAPMDRQRTVTLDTQHNLDLVDALKGLFQDSDTIAEQYSEGMLGRTGGFKFFENTLLPRHTPGTKAGTPLTNGATQGVATGWAETGTLITDGWTNSTAALKAGDIFTVADVYEVHPETKVTTTRLKRFVATADYTADGSGNIAALVHRPAAIYGGAYKNVNASIGDGKAITVIGTASTEYGQSLAFHKDAFLFVTADLIMPTGVDFAAREVYDGVSMRIVRQYTIADDAFPCRIDVLWGATGGLTELACRILGD